MKPNSAKKKTYLDLVDIHRRLDDVGVVDKTKTTPVHRLKEVGDLRLRFELIQHLLQDSRICNSCHI